MAVRLPAWLRKATSPEPATPQAGRPSASPGASCAASVEFLPKPVPKTWRVRVMDRDGIVLATCIGPVKWTGARFEGSATGKVVSGGLVRHGQVNLDGFVVCMSTTDELSVIGEQVCVDDIINLECMNLTLSNCRPACLTAPW